ncbi:MAG: hypothetical protein HKN13_10140, partial [Rhodothermales bacterium]|nr:hypothetical protein [Rhodothermales bacterium]
MSDLLDYSIPVFHPIAVHFPVAVLPVALVACIVWVYRPDSTWGSATLLLLGVAAVGSIVAFVTGDAVYAQSEGVPVVEQFVERHRLLGRLVMIGSILSVGLAASGYILGKRAEQPP